MYTAVICAVIAKPSKFTDDMKCAIYQDKHSFDNCPVLLYIPYLKKHFIAYCLLWNRSQKQMSLAVKKIRDATLADTNDNDNDVSSDIFWTIMILLTMN